MTETFEPMAELSDKRGLELFEETIGDIRNHELKTWNQGSWFSRVGPDGTPGYSVWLEDLPDDVVMNLRPAFDCGTVACLFGHVAFKAGATMYVGFDGQVSGHTIKTPQGRVRTIYGYATELLGLPEYLADYISGPDRTWEDIIAFRDAWRVDEALAGLNERDAIVQESF